MMGCFDFVWDFEIFWRFCIILYGFRISGWEFHTLLVHFSGGTGGWFCIGMEAGIT